MTEGAAGTDRPAPLGGEPAPAAAEGGERLTLFELARLEEARREAAALERTVRRGTAAAPGLRAAPARWLALGAGVLVAAVGVALLRPAAAVAPSLAAPPTPAVSEARARVVRGLDPATAPLPVTDPAHPTWGRSRNVALRLAHPGQVLDYPLTLTAPPGTFTYRWVRVADSSEASAPRRLSGSVLVAPTQPGTYRLALARAAAAAPGAPAESRILDDVTVAVLVPFAAKLGGMVNGYRIGGYPFERLGGERPQGFIEVTPATQHLRLTPHIALRDFLTHDGQRQWPRYVAVNPLLLDKLELVFGEIARLRGWRDATALRVTVNSGFRTPAYNGGVEGAAFNSRHQYGDAADVVVDADGDGRFTGFDSRLVALAAEMVERRHPELTGGLGLYLNRAQPFVHVDTRGRRARWWK